MESTGSYQEQLACFLTDHGLLVSVVNPLLVKRFAEANRQRNKTDDADAKGLALFCRSQRPERWNAPSSSVREGFRRWWQGSIPCKPCARPRAIVWRSRMRRWLHRSGA